MLRIHGQTFEPYISAAAIQERIHALGAAIAQDYQDKAPLFVAILNGSFIFAADLLRAVPIPATVSFVKLASYEGMHSSGSITEAIGLQEDIRDRHLIIVEDIVDTGRTLHYFLQQLYLQEPASVAIAALLVKPENCVIPELKVSYTGFSIPNKFVLGYGLDYDGLGRNLPDIYQLAATGEHS